MEIKKGFTLIEFIVAMTVGAILLVVAGVLQTTSSRLWLKGSNKIFLQTESSFALAVISKSVRHSNLAEVLDDGTTLQLTKVYRDQDNEITTFFLEGKDLKQQFDDEESTVILKDIVDEVLFTFPAEDMYNNIVYRGVGVKMTLLKSKESFSSEKVIAMRNIVF